MALAPVEESGTERADTAGYVFIDEWEVDAPIDATFDALRRAHLPAVVATPIPRGRCARWNHAWAIARAIEGLEPYARERSMRK